MPEAMLADLVAARAARRAVAYGVQLESWARRLLPAPPMTSCPTA
jgi:xanthine dehydrogenase accessory factor